MRKAFIGLTILLSLGLSAIVNANAVHPASGSSTARLAPSEWELWEIVVIDGVTYWWWLNYETGDLVPTTRPFPPVRSNGDSAA